MLSLHSIWWIWKAWYWISYKSWILFGLTHNFSMVNMQKSYHRSFESFLYKIFRPTASFHILQMLSLHSIWWIWKAWYWISYKSWIFLDGPTTFQWLTCRRVSVSQIIWAISLQNLPAYCFVPHLADAEPVLDLVDLKGLVLNHLQVMDFVQMDPQLFNG